MRTTAYCTASAYQLAPLFDYFRKRYPSTLYRDVIHVTDPPHVGDLFFFDYGVGVFWGLTENEEREWLDKIKDFEKEPLPRIEKDLFSYSYGDQISIERDEIVLTNKDGLTKLAISYALAQSVKLSVFEEKIDKIIESTKNLPEDLAKEGKIFLSRKQISRKIGALFIERSSVNLHSDILDTPDFFWEYPEYNPLYRSISKSLDIVPRVELLNTRLELINQLLGILRDQLNHQHSSTLEWTIIWLIVIEVVLAILKDLFHLI